MCSHVMHMEVRGQLAGVVLSSCPVGPGIEVGHQAFSGAFYLLGHCAGSIVFSTSFLMWLKISLNEIRIYLFIFILYSCPSFLPSFFLPVAVFFRDQVGGALLPRLPVKKRRTT